MSRKKFKRTARLSWATKKDVASFADQLATAWEQAGYTEAQVLDKVRTVLDDAYNGELELSSGRVHVTKLAVELKANGVPLPERQDAKAPVTEIASKYA